MLSNIHKTKEYVLTGRASRHKTWAMHVYVCFCQAFRNAAFGTLSRCSCDIDGEYSAQFAGGRIAGQVKDVAYQSSTTDFWGSLAAVGGRGTYVLGGAFNCGKGQPGQSAPVSHGCPSALFRGVRVLNARSETAP